jgi:glycosyltransferase involved in cell wall biosynthesis
VLRLSLITLGDPQRRTGGSLYNRRLVELAPRHGARIRTHTAASSWLPVEVVRGRSLVADVRAHEPDALLVDSIAAAAVSPWFAALDGVPAVALVHQLPGGPGVDPMRPGIRARADVATYRRARVVVAVSEWLGRRLERFGVDDCAIRIAAPGRDDVGGAPASAADLRQRRRMAVLCVANWSAHKGILEAVEAVARLDPLDACLHLVGEPRFGGAAYERRVRARIGEADVRERAVVHGPMPPDRVRTMYADADVLLLPARDEAYGSVFGEAMAAGLPVVAWHDGNVPFLVRPDREGLLTAPGDVAGLARDLQRLAGDGELRRRLGAAARRRAAALATWDETTAAVLAAVLEAGSTTRRERLASLGSHRNGKEPSHQADRKTVRSIEDTARE